MIEESGSAVDGASEILRCGLDCQERLDSHPLSLAGFTATIGSDVNALSDTAMSFQESVLSMDGFLRAVADSLSYNERTLGREC